MNSKIKLCVDWDAKEPFIQLVLESGSDTDSSLKFFVEEINQKGVELVYTKESNVVELRIKK